MQLVVHAMCDHGTWIAHSRMNANTHSARVQPIFPVSGRAKAWDRLYVTRLTSTLRPNWIERKTACATARLRMPSSAVADNGTSPRTAC